MAKLTPKEAASKLIDRAKAAQGQMAAQVNKVTESPTAKAADKLEKMMTAWLEAYNSGKIERGLRSVDLASWKKAMIEKGIPRFAQGLEGSRVKIEDFMAEWLPFMDDIARELDGMDDTTFEARVQKMVHQVRRAHEFERRG